MEQSEEIIFDCKVHQLKVTTANCKQASVDVEEFYSKLMNLYKELRNHVQVLICTCGKLSQCMKRPNLIDF